MSDKTLHQIERIRSEIAAASDELEALSNALLPLNEAVDRLTKWVDSKAGLYAVNDAWHEVAPAASPGSQIGAIRVGQAATHTNTADFSGLLCFLFAPLIKERMAEVLASRLSDANTPSSAERPDLRTALLERVESLERREEQLIRQSEAAGAPIIRRPDARPDLVLLNDL